MLILSYLFPFSLIPLFMDKSADVQFHAKQGTVLGVVIFILFIGGGILANITGIGLIATVCSILGLVLLIIAIIKGFGGTLCSIPVIGGLVGKAPTPS